MEERIQQELALLRQRYPNLEYQEQGQWVRIPDHRLPPGWDRLATDVAFQIPVGYPGTPPYGIYVPVGLTFEEKGRFRSRALLVLGEAIDPEPEIDAYGADPREAARALTLRIDAGLREVTLNFPSWELSTLVERAADVFAEEQRTLPGRPELAERFSLRKAFGESYAAASEKYPDRTQQIERMARSQHHTPTGFTSQPGALPSSRW